MYPLKIIFLEAYFYLALIQNNLNYSKMLNSEDRILYADFEHRPKKNPDMFVLTPEGNYFNFPKTEYDETHEDIQIIDPKSHIVYTVKFNV